ncbi:MAG: tannase/feruloyl esterase family alpha/beta hydrolase [Acidobacteria bacterium]|nr:tannase/feruloyl esterase family alpha/beta hydrolase [Acidobacteriota bacterium]
MEPFENSIPRYHAPMRFLACPFLAASLLAQNAPHIRDWRPAASETTAQPRVTCAALHGLTGYDLSVMAAESIPTRPGQTAFCRVLIQVMPEIRIEVSLPAQWNRRLYMFGNGGFAGESLEAPNRVAQRDTALRAGFAVTQTNTGHDAEREPGASFAANPQKLLDWAFRSLHVTAETAKRTVEAYYGMKPAKSYYNGCSTGGRQALQFAQRYPEDFDGIVAGAPALDSVAGRLRGIATAQAVAKAPVPVAKLRILADRVYAKCDALDGLKDGLIDDPRRCDFNAAIDLPACSQGDGPDCFTPGQLATIASIHRDVAVDGKRVALGFPPGAEAAGPNGQSGWDGWIMRDGGMSTSASMAASALQYMVFNKPDPSYQIAQFNFARDVKHLEPLGKMLNAKDPDLTQFRDRGGKLLMYFGWADPALNPKMGIEYYEDAQRVMGPRTSEFFKLYLMPGVFHCAGGVGPACFDVLQQIVPWVEQGKAPEAIEAQRLEGGKVLRSRPLCPYPQVAKYQGSGSIDEAKNFACSLP